MRGEDVEPKAVSIASKGSPPHARGRLVVERRNNSPCGITPACAGKTSAMKLTIAPAPDHPRMRGEDGIDFVRDKTLFGSPPHARGRPVHRHLRGRSNGITPACAGKTI